MQKMGVMTVLFYPCFVFLVVLIISFCALKALGSFSHYIAWREFQAAQGWLGGPSVLRFWFNGLWLLTLLIGFCVSWIWTGKLSFGILSILLVPLVFRYFVRYQEHRWRRSIETSSLSFFNALLGLIQSGRGLSSALFDLAQSQSTPFCKKLKKHLHNYEEGRGLILILSQFRNKMGLPTLENYLSTIEMAYSQGLEIAPLLEKMIPTLEMEQQRRQCSVLGCGRMGRNKGTVNGATRYDHKCENHHRTKVRLEASSMFFRKHIKNATCETCGWSQSYCDRHRIIPTVGYTRDNVKILCPNCHRLEHEAGKPRLNL